MSQLSTEQEQICVLMGQVDALSKAMMAIFAAHPELSLAQEALKNDVAKLQQRQNQSLSDIAYAKGFLMIHESIESGSNTMKIISEVRTAKSSGSIQ